MATRLEQVFLEQFPACFDYILEHMSPTKSINAAFYEYCEKKNVVLRSYFSTGFSWGIVQLARSKNPIFRQWFELLVSLGLDVNENITGYTPLLKLLYKYYTNDDGIHINTDLNDQIVCKRLIEEGAEIQHVEDFFGTPMLSIVTSDVLAMVLIEAGIVTNIRNGIYRYHEDIRGIGWSPLLDWITVTIDKRLYLTPKKCKMLLQAGVDPKIKDDNGNTVLKILGMYDRLQGNYTTGSPKIVKEVLKPIENTSMIDMIVECL